MIIPPTGGIRTEAFRAAPSRRQAGFSMTELPSKLSETSTFNAISTDSMLFMQEVDSPQERDARSRRHGTALLDLLAELQHGLLDGTPASGVLGKLQALAGQPIVAADSSLQEAVAAITLRVHVEMARSSMR